MIYDIEQEIYFAARDAVGTRPFYYTIQNNQFYSSDDIGKLFSQSKIKKEPNIDTMVMLIHHNTVSYDTTMYKSIKRLPPGHCMVVDKHGNVEMERYWKPEEIKIDKKISKEEAKKKFLDLFDQAIFNRIEDISTTAFELSGGLDSSSIVSMTKQKYPGEKVHTVSMSFESLPHCDERDYIDAMSDKYGLDINKVNIDNLDYKNKYSLEYNYKLDPYWPILLTYTMEFPIAEKLKTMGIERVLTGQGGDQVVGGNPYCIHDYFKHFQWIRMYRELKVSNKPLDRFKRYGVLPLLSKEKKILIKSLLSLWQFKKRKIVEIESSSSIPFQELTDQCSKNSLAFWNDLNALINSAQVLALDISSYHVVEKYYGIKFFHPFYDRRLIEFMLSLPSRFKYREGVTKILLRKAMKGILPEKIRQRKDKAEFTAVIRQQIDAIDLDELLSDAYLARLELIEQSSINKLKEEYQNGKMKTLVYFWKIINMEYWYRYNFVDQKETVKH